MRCGALCRSSARGAARRAPQPRSPAVLNPLVGGHALIDNFRHTVLLRDLQGCGHALLPCMRFVWPCM